MNDEHLNNEIFTDEQARNGILEYYRKQPHELKLLEQLKPEGIAYLEKIIRPEDTAFLVQVINRLESISIADYNQLYNDLMVESDSFVKNAINNMNFLIHIFFTSEIVRLNIIEEYGNGNESLARKELKRMLIDRLVGGKHE